MAQKCDICLKTVPKRSQHLLTTTEVTTKQAYWKYAFKNQWSYVGELEESLLLYDLCLQMSSQVNPWLVCDSCIKLFKVNRESCRSRTKEDWQQFTGSADYEKTLSAAKKAFKSVFGKSFLSENPNLFMDLVISKKEPFTVNEIANELKERGVVVDVDEHFLEEHCEDLKARKLLVKKGSKYLFLLNLNFIDRLRLKIQK